MSSLVKTAEMEIRKRHDFFVDWYRGNASDDAIDECARSFAPDFRIIWPSGGYMKRAQLLKALGKARNSAGPEFEIRIDIDHALELSPDLCLMTFDEHQKTAEGPNSRRGTAVFQRDENAPNGVVWRHLQETWITET